MAVSLQLIQGPPSTPNADQSSDGVEKESCSTETLNKSTHIEQVLIKPEEQPTNIEGAIMSDGSKDTKKQLTETENSKTSDKKQVDTISKPFSPQLLKWSNNPITQAKGKKKKV